MKTTVRRVANALTGRIVVEEIDITADPDLEARYGQQIPVLLIDGRKVAKYRITSMQLERILETAVARDQT